MTVIGIKDMPLVMLPGPRRDDNQVVVLQQLGMEQNSQETCCRILMRHPETALTDFPRHDEQLMQEGAVEASVEGQLVV